MGFCGLETSPKPETAMGRSLAGQGSLPSRVNTNVEFKSPPNADLDMRSSFKRVRSLKDILLVQQLVETWLEALP